MPGTALEDEFYIDFFDIFAVVLHKAVTFIPGIGAPLVVGRIGRHRAVESDTIAQRVHVVVAGGHVGKMRFTFGGAKLHQTADSDLPALVGSILLVSYDCLPVRLPLGVVLVAFVGITRGCDVDRKEMDVLPCGCAVVAVVGVNGTDGCFPDGQEGHKCLCEVLDGTGHGFDIRILRDGNALGIVFGGDDDFTGAGLFNRIVVDGYAHGSIAGCAAGGSKMDPVVLGSRRPRAGSGELNVLGCFRSGFEGQFVGLENNRKFLVVKLEVDLHVLEGIVHVLVDVVVEHVLVEAGKDEELTHRADEAFVAFEVQRGGAGAELLEVTDHAQRAVVVVRDETADNMPGAAFHDELETDFGQLLSVVLDGTAVVLGLIPGVFAPDASCGRRADRRTREGLAVAVRNLTVAGVGVEECFTFGGTHVHETADSDFPALCSGVGGTFDFYRLVRLVLGIPLAALLDPVVLGVLGNRDEVDSFPCAVVILASGTVCAEGFSNGVLPDFEILDEFRSPSLEGGAAAQILGGNRCGELSLGGILCQRAGDGHHRTVGGECQRVVASVDQGLVGELALLVSCLYEAGCDRDDVLIHALAVFRAVHDSDFIFVIAVAVGVRRCPDALDRDVGRLALADGNQRGSAQIEVIRYLEILAVNGDGCGDRAVFFPRCVNVSGGCDDLGDCYAVFNFGFLGAARHCQNAENHRKQKSKLSHNK